MTKPKHTQHITIAKQEDMVPWEEKDAIRAKIAQQTEEFLKENQITHIKRGETGVKSLTVLTEHQKRKMKRLK